MQFVTAYNVTCSERFYLITVVTLALVFGIRVIVTSMVPLEVDRLGMHESSRLALVA